MMRHFVILCLTPLLTGFVLLSPHGAKLDVSAEMPEVMFVWNGETPTIDKKNEYAGGAYQDLNDRDFFAQLLQDAMDVWNEVPGSYVIMTMTEGDGIADPEDGQHSIVIDSVNASTAAFASPRPDENNPKILFDCDITISSKKVKARSVAFTIAHELGHCLGLGHPHTNYSAMMSYSRGSTSLKLGADDIAGIIYLYPDPNYSDGEPKELLGCGVVAGMDRSSAAFFLMLLMGAPLLLAGALGSRTAPTQASRRTANSL